MTALTDLLPPGWNDYEPGVFQPCAIYNPAMDSIIYLREDVSYRADRIDQFTTLLWHPYEDKAVGVKLKGGRYLFERLKAILAPLGYSLEDKHFMPLMSALEFAMTAECGEELTDKAEAERAKGIERRVRLYKHARDIVGNAGIDTYELAVAA